jgi:hypothetical protein
MTENIQISGDTAIRSAPVEAPSIDVELPAPPPPDPDKAPEFPVASWPEDPAEREDLAIRQSVKELNKQRAERGDRWVTSDGFDQKSPVATWDASSLPESGSHESPYRQARRASDALRSARMAAKAAAFETLPSMTPQESRQAAEIFDKIPVVRVSTVSDRGEPVPALDDHQPVDAALDGFKNLAEANRAMKNWRTFAQQQEQNLMAELQGREALQNAELQQALAAPTAPEPAPQQQQPQPDAQAQQARALEAQRRAAAYWQNISEGERAAANEIGEIRQWLPAEFTQQELRDPSLVTDPERRGWLATAVDRHNALLGHLQQSQHLRNAQQIVATQARDQQLAQWGKQHDDVFQRELERRHPQLWANQGKMREAAKRYLKEDMGMSQEQIDAQWKAGSLRTAQGQLMLADAIAAKMARESVSAKALAQHRRPVPPVQVPGVSRPRGAASEDEMRDLYRQLDGAKGDRAIKIATRIGQLKRDAS